MSVQKFRLKDNFVGRDPVEPQPFGHLGSIVELEHRKRRAIAKFRSAVGVDVIHHKADLFLAVEAQIPAFWKDSADQSMVVFTGAFLPRGRGIAVKEPGTRDSLAIRFQGAGIGKLGSIIRKKNGKQLPIEVRTEGLIQVVEDVGNGFGIVASAQEGELKLWKDEMEGQKNGPAFYAFHRVQLDNRQLRVVLPILEERFVGATDAAGFVHLKGNGLAFSGAEADFPGHIDVFGVEQAAVGIPVGGFFATGDGIAIVHKNVVEGVSVFEKRADHRVQLAEFFFGQVKTGSGFGANLQVFLMGLPGAINVFFQGAEAAVRTAVANIRGLEEPGAGFLYVIRTGIGTFAAGAAFLAFVVAAYGAGRGRVAAGGTERAVVKGSIRSALFFKEEMSPDFFGDGGAVFAEPAADFFKAETFLKELLKIQTFLEGQVFIFVHK